MPSKVVLADNHMLESYQFVLNVEDKEIRNKPISIWPNPMIDNINFSLELQDASNVMLNLTDQFGNNEIFEGIILLYKQF